MQGERQADAGNTAPGACLHPDVLRLGMVSFLTDLSSEMIFSVFAVFFTTVAGATTALLGLIEGLADLSASSLNVLAGWLSDRSGRRKAFVVAGYAFSTLAKGILALSAALAGAAVFRVVERLGKGFRGPPRDAWLSGVTANASRGLSFGVHKALDKAGAVLGPLAAWALLSTLGESPDTYRLLFWIALVPAAASVLLLLFLDDRPSPPLARESPLASWRLLAPDFRRFLVPSAVFALAYYSLGFILLRAHDTGFGITGVVLLYALFNAVCVAAAPLAGALGDRIGRGRMVMAGYGLYAMLNLWLVFAEARWQIVCAMVLYGVFYAVDEAQNKALIADLEPRRRATAVGMFNLVTGMAYLSASLLAGALWHIDPAAAFGAACVLSLVAMRLFPADVGSAPESRRQPRPGSPDS